MADRHAVCRTGDLPPGERRIVEVRGFTVGVFNVDGEYHALKNECPHRRAPLCEGTLTGTTTADGVGDVSWEREGRILRCPWHGWEFDVATGESVFDPHEVRAKTFETEVEPDETGSQDESGSFSQDESGSFAGEPPVETYEVDVVDGTVYVVV